MTISLSDLLSLSSDEIHAIRMCAMDKRAFDLACFLSGIEYRIIASNQPWAGRDAEYMREYKERTGHDWADDDPDAVQNRQGPFYLKD